MRNLGTGIGISVGAAIGFVFGPLLFTDWWWAPIVGAAAGLLVGAVVDARTGAAR